MLSCKQAGRYTLKCRVRTDSVVVFEPTLSNVANLLKVLKQISIQNIFSVGAVEALNVGILRWFARLDMEQLDVFLLCPALQSLRDQLRAVIHANVSGRSMPREQLL